MTLAQALVLHHLPSLHHLPKYRKHPPSSTSIYAHLLMYDDVRDFIRLTESIPRSILDSDLFYTMSNGSGIEASL